MTDGLKRDLVAEAEALFAFLTSRGFRHEFDDDTWIPTLAYARVDVVFEVKLDLRDGVAMVLVCRSVKGKRPPGYYMHQGRRMRLYLSAALQEVGLLDSSRDDAHREDLGHGAPEAMLAQLRVESEILETQLDQLLAHVGTLFPG